MGQKVDLRLAALLDEAETRTSCLVPANDADRKALDRRKPAEVICPRPGLYARRAKWELLKRHPDIRALMVVRGLATQHPDWVFAHVSAALAHGLQVSGRSLGKIHLATNQTAHTESSGQIVRHCVPNEELAECVSVGGVRVTSLLRTAFDCMRSLPADEALVVADSLLRKTGRTAWWLVRTIKDAYCGWRGIGRALAVARFADGRSENGGESMARAAIIRQGLEVPVLQQWFFDPVEGLGRRVDFAWYNEAGELVAIGELDGACKLEDADKVGKGGATEVLSAERRRESRLTFSKVPVGRFTFAEATRDGYLRRLLTAAGVPMREPGAVWARVRRMGTEGRPVMVYDRVA